MADVESVSVHHQTVAVTTDGGAYVAGNVTAAHDVVLRDQWNIYHGLTPAQLDAALLKVVQTAHAENPPLSWNGRDPYPGLNAFQEADTDLFFGRDVVVDEVAQRLSDSAFLCITGPSGSGKSSLVQAGVVPRLRQMWTDSGQACLTVRMVPGADPLLALADAVAQFAQQARQLTPALDAPTFQMASETDFGSLSRCLQSLLRQAGNNTSAFLFVDQFEEVFTQSPNLKSASVFVSQIAQAVHESGNRVRIALGLRSDFLAACAEYPNLNTLLNQHFYQIGPMQPMELARAILGPATRVGVTIQLELAAQIIADMRNEPGALPLMQFALRNMFMAQGARKGDAVTLTQSAYQKGGSVFDALNRHADAVLASLNAEQQALARTLFLRLVEVGQNGKPDTRRTIALDEVMMSIDGSSAESTAAVIQVLTGTRARLLTTGQQPNGQRSLALTHERLIQSWAWLHRLIDENRADIQVRNRLSADVDEWEKKKRTEDLLYSGTRLEEALASITRMRWQLSPLETDFIDNSAQRDQKFERARYMTQARGGAIGGGLGFSSIMAIAFIATLNTRALGSLSFVQQMAILILLTLLTLPVGAFLGFLIGIGLWISRKGGFALQVGCAAGLGGIAGGVALLLTGFAFNPDMNPGSAALAGVVLGAGLGMGSAIAPQPGVRVLTALAGGAVGLIVTAQLGVIFQNQMLLAGLAGVLLGGQLGWGFERAAANRKLLNSSKISQRHAKPLLSTLSTLSHKFHKTHNK